MKTCETCGREYLESYESCPFCARNFTFASAPPTPRRRRAWFLGPLFGGVAVLILLFLAFNLVSLYGGVREIGKAQETACFAKQVAVERAAIVYSNEHDGAPVTDLSALVPRELDALPVCPDDGRYTWTWDADHPRLTCSKHGWHGSGR